MSVTFALLSDPKQITFTQIIKINISHTWLPVLMKGQTNNTTAEMKIVLESIVEDWLTSEQGY